MSEAIQQEPQPAPRPALRSPWQIQRAVLYALFVRELKTRFGGRWVGALWTLAEPLAHLVVMLLIFRYVRQRLLPGLDFEMFLITGLVPFFMFRSLALRLMDAVDANRALFGYRQVKPMDALLSRALLETGIYSTVYLVLLAVLGWIGFTVLPARPLELMGVSLLLLAVGFGAGTILAVATDDLPRVRSFVRILFFPLYILSGVVFPVASLPPEIRAWLMWNPILHALEISRGFYFPAYHVLQEVSLSYVFGCALVFVSLGLSMYRVRRNRLVAT